MKTGKIADDFVAELAPGFQVAALCASSPDACAYVKNRRGQFVWGNDFLLELCGVKTLAEAIGKTDFDFFPRDLALDYRREDEQTMKTGVAVVKRPWVVCGANKTTEWFLSSKTPLYGRPTKLNASAPVVGVAGLMRNYRRFDKSSTPRTNDLQNAVDLILCRYGEKLELKELAAAVFLSVSQFERRFFATFQMTPRQFLADVRLRAAARLLVSCGASLAQIASETGFCDQSHFGKAFRAAYGTTPREYRRENAEPDVLANLGRFIDKSARAFE